MLGAFMSGLTSGMESMISLRAKADELRMQLDSNEALREAAKTTKAIETNKNYGGGGDLPSSTPDFPIPDTTTPTTGSGGSGGDRGGGSSGAMGWGDHAKTTIDELKKLSWKDGAIQGVLANGLAEGGFKENWVKAGGGENSRGHFQFYEQGEMPGYLKWAAANGVTDPHETAPQVQYLAKRMEEIHPGFGQIDNAYDATDIVGTRFERYKGAAPGQRYGHLATVQKYYNQPNYGLGAPPNAQTQTAALDPYGGRDRQDPYPTTGPVAPSSDGPVVATSSTPGQPGPAYNVGQTYRGPAAPTPPTAALGGDVLSDKGGYGSSAPAPSTPSAPTQALAPSATRPMTQKQQYAADIKAGRRPVFPPGTKFNSRGEAISSDLKAPLPGAYIPAAAPPAKTAALGDLYGGALT